MWFRRSAEAENEYTTWDHVGDKISVKDLVNFSRQRRRPATGGNCQLRRHESMKQNRVL